MTHPLPAAPPQYSEPSWRHDDIDVLVMIDRSDGFPVLDETSPLAHPIDRFAVELEKHLQALMNVCVCLRSTDDVRYQEDIPAAIYAVVTNSSAYADWCRSWSGNVVEVAADGEMVAITARDTTKRFSSGELQSALEFAADETQYVQPGPLDTGTALLDPISQIELANIELLLAQLWGAVDNETLTAIHRHQIVAMAELISAEQRAATPGETQRWKLVGPVQSALKYIAKEMPKDLLAWWKVIEILQGVNWTTVASSMPGT